jgi:hypothetical protein
MRAILTKIVAGSMIASAALLVSACGSKTETTTENTVVTDLNTADVIEGTVSDNMTAVDGAMGDNAAMANDTAPATNAM